MGEKVEQWIVKMLDTESNEVMFECNSKSTERSSSLVDTNINRKDFYRKNKHGRNVRLHLLWKMSEKKKISDFHKIIEIGTKVFQTSSDIYNK